MNIEKIVSKIGTYISVGVILLIIVIIGIQTYINFKLFFMLGVTMFGVIFSGFVVTESYNYFHRKKLK